MSDPDRNPMFRRRWSEPDPPKRQRPAPPFESQPSQSPLFQKQSSQNSKSARAAPAAAGKDDFAAGRAKIRRRKPNFERVVRIARRWLDPRGPRP
jgi:hypothetical protein